MMALDTNLDELRQGIDRIDDSIHDLLMQRAALVEQIGKRKGRQGTPVLQLAREARILRRLAGRHRGPLPFAVVARLWREIISAFTTMQQPLGVAVYAPDTRNDTWDLARDHYGSQAPMAPFQTISQVIRAVTDRSATVGVLPMPREEEADPWWRQLLTRDSTAPRIIARLPFAGGGNGRGAGAALAIASHVGDTADFDRCYLLIDMTEPVSRARLTQCLTAAGFECSLLALCKTDGQFLALAELDGDGEAADPRFAVLAEQLGTPRDRLCHLGGYADPIPVDGQA